MMPENKMFGLVVTFLVVGLVVAPKPKPKFEHDFARNTMLPLTAAAYASNPRFCLGQHFSDWEFVNHYEKVCGHFLIFARLTCAAYTAVLHDKKAIVLSFRGTHGRHQLEKETIRHGLGREWFNGAKVNTYFHDAFMSLWNDTMPNSKNMLEDVQRLIQEYEDYQIWITGHSLGGAMASLAASYLLETQVASAERTKLVTFGQPKTGDKVFADNFNHKINYAFRVIHANDGVPHIPPTTFVHNYHHHKYEVYYYTPDMEDGSFIVCDEETYAYKYCSARLSWTSLDIFYAHTHYYGRYLSYWGEDGCPVTLNI